MMDDELSRNTARSHALPVETQLLAALQSRFRCLDKSGGTLLYSAEKTCQLVTATAVLHNFSMSRRLNAVVDPAVMARNAAIQPPTVHAAQPAPALTVAQLRQTVVQQF